MHDSHARCAGPGAGRGIGPDPPGRQRGRAHIPARQDDRGTASGQHPGSLQPEAGAGTGHHRRPP